MASYTTTPAVKRHIEEREKMTISRMEVTKIVELAHELEQHVLLYGPVGTGKTTAGRMAAAKGQPVFHISLTSEQSAAALVGHYIPKEGSFEWHDGPALKAWRTGGLLLIDEVDKSSPDCGDVLHMILNDFSVAEYTLPTNETVKPVKGFRVVATMNGVPSDLPEAVRDRFTCIIRVGEPDKAQYKQLSKEMEKLCRGVYNTNAHKVKYSFRQLRMLDRLLQKGLEMEKAVAAVTEEGQEKKALIEALNLAKIF